MITFFRTVQNNFSLLKLSLSTIHFVDLGTYIQDLQGLVMDNTQLNFQLNSSSISNSFPYKSNPKTLIEKQLHCLSLLSIMLPDVNNKNAKLLCYTEQIIK